MTLLFLGLVESGVSELTRSLGLGKYWSDCFMRSGLDKSAQSLLPFCPRQV